MKRNNKNRYLYIAAIFIAAMLPYTACPQSTPILLPPGTVEGRLPNGLHYLILHNASPASRVEFRLIMRVGSVQETEQEKGCAHFLEHVTFGGTRHFPKRSLVEYLESLGMKYGQDINAFTGFDRTIYMFAVPTDFAKDEALDRSLLILHDWLDGVTIDPEKVENEKGIILEELRGFDPEDDFYPLKIGQGIFSHRMPLGTTDDIRKVTPQVLKNYYHKWYVPSLATLVIVGDISPLEIESKIKERFKSLPGRPVNDFRNYPLEYTRGIHLASIRDSLQPRTKVELMIPHPCTVERTMEDAIAKEKGRLLVSAISSRFRARKLKTDVTDQWYLSDKNHFVLTVEGENRKEILTSISATVSLLNDLIRNGWQEDELQDIKNNFCRRMKLSTDAPSRPSSMWCDDFADYVISGDRYLTDPSQQQQLKEAMSRVSGQSLQTLLKEWMSYREETLLVACSTHPGLGAPLSETEIASAWAQGEQVECTPFLYFRPEKQEEIDIETPPCLAARFPFDPASVLRQTEYPQNRIREVELKNGIRLVLKPTLEADSTLLITSFAPFGTSSLSDEEYPLLEGFAGYIDMGDIAKVDGQVLSDYLFRKEISLSMAVENHWHGFIGMSPTANAPELFNLIYEKIFDPELKYDEFEEIRQDLLENQDKETILEKMLQRSPDRLLSARINELTGTGFARSSQKLSSEQIKNLNLDSIAAFYKKLYTNPQGTTYVICGNFNADTLMQQFVSVFGRIPVSSHLSRFSYPHFNFPVRKHIEGFPNDNDTQTLFDYLLPGHYQPGLKNTLTLKLMRDLIRNRLISVLREQKSLVYSPYISLMYEGIPQGIFYFDINASADNDNMPQIEQLLKEILHQLKQQEVDNEELNTLKRSFLIAKREALNEESPSAWRTALVGLLKNGETISDFDHYEQCLDSITPAMLREAFRRYLDTENYILLYLSKNKLKNDTSNH